MDISIEQIREQALALGWNDVGITSALINEKDVSFYEEWLGKGYHGDLAYMENHIRTKPEELFPGAKTAIIFVTYYKQPKEAFEKGKGVVASYARGRDYHHVHRKRLKKFIAWLEMSSAQQGIAKGFSDSTPIMEKALAVQAGLGWFGKNTLLIHRRFGTFILLSGILTTLDLPHTSNKELDLRLPRCGVCNRCLDACPTQAFVSPYQLDARRCLSYHLIESKKPLPEEISKRNPGYVFGCDICQDVCPHNVRPSLPSSVEFDPERGMGAALKLENLEQILERPEDLFGTPLQRKGAQGLMENFKTLNYID